MRSPSINHYHNGNVVNHHDSPTRYGKKYYDEDEDEDENDRIQVTIRLRPSLSYPIHKKYFRTNEALNSIQLRTNTNTSNENNYGSRYRETANNSTTPLTFDHVLDETCSNFKLYKNLRKNDSQGSSIQHMIETLVTEGHNCAIIAHGLSGSGKTFTIHGSSGDSDVGGTGRMVSPNNSIGENMDMRTSNSEPGILQYIAKDIFRHVERTKDSFNYTVRASYVEIYQEEIRDLIGDITTMPTFGDDQQQFRHRPQYPSKLVTLREDSRRGVVLNCNEIIVKNADAITKLAEEGYGNGLVTTITMHNDERNQDFPHISSSSHTVFRITVECREKYPNSDNEGISSDGGNDLINNSSRRTRRIRRNKRYVTEQQKSNSNRRDIGNVRISTLNIVDIASCSDISLLSPPTNADLRSVDETDQSFSSLSHVLLSLGDSHRESTIDDFRESKLTQLLQPCLTGSAKVALICCLATDKANIDNSTATLQFASEIKSIMQKSNKHNRNLSRSSYSIATSAVDEESTVTEYPISSNLTDRLRLKHLQHQLDMKQIEEQRLVELANAAERKAADAIDRLQILNEDEKHSTINELKIKIYRQGKQIEMFKLKENSMLEKTKEVEMEVEKLMDQKHELLEKSNKEDVIRTQLESKLTKAEEQSNAMDSEIEKLEGEKDKLKSTIEDLHEQRTQTDKKLSEMSHQIFSLHEEMASTQSEKEKITSRMANVQQRMEILKDQINGLNEKNYTLEKVILEMEERTSKEVDENRAELFKITEKLKAADEELDELRQANMDANVLIENIQLQKQNLKAEVEGLVQKTNLLENKIVELEKQNQTESTENKPDEDSNNMNRLVTNVKPEDINIIKKIADLFASNNDNAREEFKRLLNCYTEKIDENTSQTDDTTENNEIVPSPASSSSENCEAILPTSSGISVTSSFKEVENPEAQRNSDEKLLAVIGQQVMEHAELEKEKKILVEHVASLEAQLDSNSSNLSREVEELKSSLIAAENELKDEKTKGHEVSNKMLAEIEHLKVARNEMEERLDAMSRSNNHLELELNSMKAAGDDSKNRFCTLMSEKDALVNENAKLVDELEKLKSILNELEDKVQVLSDERDAAYDIEQRLRTEIEDSEALIPQGKTSSESVSSGTVDGREEKSREQLQKLECTSNSYSTELDVRQEIRDLTKERDGYLSECNTLLQEIDLLIIERDDAMSQNVEMEHLMKESRSRIQYLEHLIAKNNFDIRDVEDCEETENKERDVNHEHNTVKCEKKSESGSCRDVTLDLTGESTGDLQYLFGQMQSLIKEREYFEEQIKVLTEERDFLRDSLHIKKEISDYDGSDSSPLFSGLISPDSAIRKKLYNESLSHENVKLHDSDNDTMKENAQYAALVQKLFIVLKSAEEQHAKLSDENNELTQSKAKILEENTQLRREVENIKNSLGERLKKAKETIPSAKKRMTTKKHKDKRRSIESNSSDGSGSNSTEAWVCSSLCN